jgi:phosphate/sulfate permease
MRIGLVAAHVNIPVSTAMVIAGGVVDVQATDYHEAPVGADIR